MTASNNAKIPLSNLSDIDLAMVWCGRFYPEFINDKDVEAGGDDSAVVKTVVALMEYEVKRLFRQIDNDVDSPPIGDKMAIAADIGYTQLILENIRGNAHQQ